ncbi:hypothetical protein YB2330_005398 [Saitoella coloradoensis]
MILELLGTRRLFNPASIYAKDGGPPSQRDIEPDGTYESWELTDLIDLIIVLNTNNIFLEKVGHKSRYQTRLSEISTSLDRIRTAIALNHQQDLLDDEEIVTFLKQVLAAISELGQSSYQRIK